MKSGWYTFRAGLAFLVLLMLTSCTAAPGWKGKVIGVTDGDTIKVLRNKEVIKVRLDGVDCPEKKQAYGMKAKQATSALVFGKVVTVEVKDTDRYGRKVAVIRLPDGSSLNETLVAKGMAWWYREYAPNNRKLAALEAKARRSKLGLWAAKRPVAPWTWRKRERRRRLIPRKYRQTAVSGSLMWAVSGGPSRA